MGVALLVYYWSMVFIRTTNSSVATIKIIYARWYLKKIMTRYSWMWQRWNTSIQCLRKIHWLVPPYFCWCDDAVIMDKVYVYVYGINDIDICIFWILVWNDNWNLLLVDNEGNKGNILTRKYFTHYEMIQFLNFVVVQKFSDNTKNTIYKQLTNKISCPSVINNFIVV